MRITAIFAVVGVLAGCAVRPTYYVPVVDLRGGSQDQYNVDVAECHVLARQRPSGGDGAATGAVAGALLGALIAPDGYKGAFARDGAVFGGLGGASRALSGRERIVRNCVSGRGYSVLD